MPQPLRIALEICAAVGILGLGGILFWRSLRRSDDPIRLLVKWAITALIAGWVLYEAFRAQGFNKFAVLFFVALPSAAVLIVLWGRTIGEFVARPFENMLTGGSE